MVGHPDVERLTSLLPPPEKLAHNSGDWDAFETQLGTPLPTDFKEFTETFGSVTFCDYFWLHCPFVQPEADAIQEILSQLSALDAVVDGRSQVPYPNFPTPGGLLPAGGTFEGAVLFWVTEGAPDDWGTFFWSSHGVNVVDLPTAGVVRFLVELFEGTSPLFQIGFPPELFSESRRSVEACERLY